MAQYLAMNPNKDLPVRTKYLLLLVSIVLISLAIFWRKSILNLIFPPPPTAVIESTGSQTHVFWIDGQKKIQLSQSNTNHSDPFSRGDFVVWTEEPQDRSEKYIVRLHIPTGTVVKITSSQVAQQPRVNTQGAVVWQGWEDEGWHIFYFDGYSTKRLTSQGSQLNPDISGNQVVFAEKLKAGRWQAVLLDLTDLTQEVVRTGQEAKRPRFEGTSLVFSPE